MDEDKVAASKDAVALGMLPTLAVLEEDLLETPEAFLTGVSADLKTLNDVDADLATILSDHLLTVTPHANVVVNAKAAILALAAKRAALAEEQIDG